MWRRRVVMSLIILFLSLEKWVEMHCNRRKTNLRATFTDTVLFSFAIDRLDNRWLEEMVDIQSLVFTGRRIVVDGLDVDIC